MSNNLTQFENLKKRRAKQKLRKRIFVVVVLFACLFCVRYIYDRGLGTDLLNNVNCIYKMFKHGSGYPISLNATTIRGKSKMGNEFLILDDDIVYIFNMFGYKMLYTKHNLNNPRVVANKNKAVIFEHLGKNYKVYSKTSKLFESTLDNIIYNVSVSKDGKIGLIKDSNRYVSSLEILGNDYNTVFKWNSADKYMTVMEFSDNGSNFVVGSIDVDGANYVSTLDFFNIHKDKKIAEIKLNDDIIISFKYKNGYVYAVGEKNTYVINNKAEIIQKYDYKSKFLKAYYNNLNNSVILIFDSYSKVGNNQIIVLDDKLEEKGRKNITGKIIDITADNNKLHVLTDNSLMTFRLNLDVVKNSQADNMVTDVISVNNRVYQFNILKLNVVE